MKKTVTVFTSIALGAKNLCRKLSKPNKPFVSADYWERRYESGGTSGDGSYGKLAEFKARIINGFVLQNRISTVIEYGCGDGNQLKLANYPSYIGYDVSRKAVEVCRNGFFEDFTKQFKVIGERDNEKAELTLSLDVIYHLTEDEVFFAYMNRLFDSSTRFVVIYSSNTEDNPQGSGTHERHRAFTEWVTKMQPRWFLHTKIENIFPYSGDTRSGSIADFYIYKLSSATVN